MTAKGIIERLRDSKQKMGTYADPGVISKVTEYVPTGCLPLDWTIGAGKQCLGAPVGRITEIYGNNSTGKTLLGASILAQTQLAGGLAVMYDTETAASSDMLAAAGVDMESLVYTTPELVEDVWDQICQAIECKAEVDKESKGEPSLMTILWDSVAATSCSEELEVLKKKGLKGYTQGAQARQLSKMCRNLPHMVASNRVCLIFINQTREDIGVIYGDNTAVPGGKAIGFYSSLILELNLKSKIKAKEEPGAKVTGIEVEAYVVKSKVAAPFGRCKFPIMFDRGIDEAVAFLNLLEGEGYVVKAGLRKKLVLPGYEESQPFPYIPSPQIQVKKLSIQTLHPPSAILLSIQYHVVQPILQ